MKRHLILSVVCTIIALICFSCSNSKNESGKRVIIAIPADVTTYNPMFASSVNEGNISELIYLSLVEFNWDQGRGDITTEPMLAKSYEWSSDSLSLIVHLREDIFWSDGVQFNADDVIFTYDLYSDPKAQSKFYGMFKNYYVKDDLSIDIGKSFEVLSPFKIKINFHKNSAPSLFDVGYPILPKHIFGKIPREGLANAEENLKPVGTGPYKLSAWEKNQSIKLVGNEKSVLYNKSVIPELIFEIVPDYNSRINKLKSGEIDFAEEIKPIDVEELNKSGNIKIELQKGRSYDYVGWNNIDPDIYGKNKKIFPNKFFGTSNVRKALTYAIDRKTILEEFLANYGEAAVGPIAPIFKNSIDQNLKQYPYDPEKAKEILEREGWKDSNLNGIIDKNGREFSFTLVIPGGNPLRKFTATMIKDDLKAIGIDVTVETVEPQVFWSGVFAKKYDAWVAGWMVPIPLNLKPYWHSDLKNNAVNLVSYQNKEADRLLEKAESKISKDELNKTYKEFLSILYDDAPVTFLFWKDNIVAYNKKISGVAVSPLGVVHKCWNWSISE
jgi:peptide/nickel transport system substrate-binding protein